MIEVSPCLSPSKFTLSTLIFRIKQNKKNPFANQIQLQTSIQRKKQTIRKLHSRIDKSNDRELRNCVVHPDDENDALSTKYRYRNENKSDCHIFLNKRIKYIEGGLLYEQRFCKRKSFISSPDKGILTNKVTLIGRIIDVYETKLHERILLMSDVSCALKGVRFKMAAIEGIFLSENVIVAFRFYDTLPLTRRQLQLKADISFSNHQIHPFSMLVASGPYTSENNLRYEAFQELLYGPVESICPSFVLLLGPFVGEDHTYISKELPNEMYDEIFMTHFLNRLRSFTKDHIFNKTVFILMNSIKDVHAIPVYPQPEINLWKYCISEDEEYIKSAPNPCTLCIRGLNIITTSASLVNPFEDNKYFYDLDDISLQMNYAKHIVQQRHFYPIYPPNRNNIIDYSKQELLELVMHPNLVIIPSQLQPYTNFMRENADKMKMQNVYFPKLSDYFDSFGVLNPGQLTKNGFRGTFAIIKVSEIKDVPSTNCISIKIKLL